MDVELVDRWVKNDVFILDIEFFRVLSFVFMFFEVSI